MVILGLWIFYTLLATGICSGYNWLIQNHRSYVSRSSKGIAEGALEKLQKAQDSLLKAAYAELDSIDIRHGLSPKTLDFLELEPGPEPRTPKEHVTPWGEMEELAYWEILTLKYRYLRETGLYTGVVEGDATHFLNSAPQALPVASGNE